MEHDNCCTLGGAGASCCPGAGIDEVDVVPTVKEPAMVMAPRDNVATALTDLAMGAIVTAGGQTVRLRRDIPFGHKYALVDIPAGQPVIKYGETIGLAKAPISPGDHVHRHNVDHRVESIILNMREQP